MSVSERSLRVLSWVTLGLMLLSGVVSFLMDRVSGYKTDWGFAVIILAFPFTGFVVLQKRPRNTLAWLMLGMGFVVALPFQDYAEYALVKGLPGAGVGLAMSEWTWVPFIGISGFLLMLFPDGHLPTPRWRWFAWTCGLGLALLGGGHPVRARERSPTSAIPTSRTRSASIPSSGSAGGST